jgi:hypothetical protein
MTQRAETPASNRCWSDDTLQGNEMPICACLCGLVDDVLGGMFCAFEPSWKLGTSRRFSRSDQTRERAHPRTLPAARQQGADTSEDTRVLGDLGRGASCDPGKFGRPVIGRVDRRFPGSYTDEATLAAASAMRS